MYIFVSQEPINPLKTFRTQIKRAWMTFWGTTENFSGQCKYSINVELLIGEKSIMQKAYHLNFWPFCAIFSNKMAENWTFKTLYSFEWIGIFQTFFSFLTSLCWRLSETIIRYPIILKTKFDGNFVTSFPAKNAKIWKAKNIGFLEWWVLYCCKISSELR